MLSTNVDSAASRLSKKKTYPAKGKRYSKAQKEEILEYAKADSVSVVMRPAGPGNCTTWIFTTFTFISKNSVCCSSKMITPGSSPAGQRPQPRKRSR